MELKSKLPGETYFLVHSIVHSMVTRTVQTRLGQDLKIESRTKYISKNIIEIQAKFNNF